MAEISPESPITPFHIKKPDKHKSVNPIEAAIRSWLDRLPNEVLEGAELSLQTLLSRAPKRWVVYPPMVLLPAGSFGEDWWSILESNSAASAARDALWVLILDTVGKKEGKGPLTHLAVNSGIPLLQESVVGSRSHNALVGRVNFLRTPTGLIMLYGDFGPALLPGDVPDKKQFDDAFWVRTKQNGIIQIWAPRYTMFSRGNIKEKARLLDFHNSNQTLVQRGLSKESIASATAVDLYAGIGYFVFSYIKMGMRRVVGWELNPWSAEGLRRGAIANGWRVRVVKEAEELTFGGEEIVVVLEDNRKFPERFQCLDKNDVGVITHVNCGLLPTSVDSWDVALKAISGNGWLHLHENVAVNDVKDRGVQIRELFRDWLRKEHDERVVEVEHIEFVKTFAPGVWHCVFDIYVHGPESPN